MDTEKLDYITKYIIKCSADNWCSAFKVIIIIREYVLDYNCTQITQYKITKIIKLSQYFTTYGGAVPSLILFRDWKILISNTLFLRMNHCLYPPDALLDLFQGYFLVLCPPINRESWRSTDSSRIKSSKYPTNELRIIHRPLFSIQPQLKGISPQDMRGLRVDEVLKYHGPREENGTT